jgi:uncharacterized membrane protein YeiH
VISTIGGGILRDIMTKKPIKVMESEIDINTSSAVVGSTLYALGHITHLPINISVLFAFGSVLLFREKGHALLHSYVYKNK